MTEQLIEFPIYDKHGHKYRLAMVEDEHGIYSQLWDNCYPVGRLNLVFHPPDKWEITDIVVFDEIQEEVGWLQRLALGFTGHKPQKVDYRNRGLGTALLQFVEERARQRQVKCIIGSVTKKDYAAWPELLNWYAKNGFVVKLMCDEQNEHRDVACISKDIA